VGKRKDRPIRKGPYMMRVTSWAHHLLSRELDRLRSDVESHPERYPALASRRVTFSDLIVALCERIVPNDNG
jgi:hypothetical protein